MDKVDDYIFRFVGKDDVSGTMRRIGTGAKATEGSVRGVQTHINGMRMGLRGVANEIPGMNMLFNSMLGPIGIASAGVGLIAKELNASTEAAHKFNSEFRELQNLNIDKPIRELNHLKLEVLSTAGSNGFDPNKTSTAFYDVQSITGMYGDGVKDIVEKQGEFARLMNADFNQYITGTGKAMTNYGFGTEELDAYNRSAYATVKVGKITFEELAKNQAVYAGYAASANQTFDSANKLMTLFTIKTKSAEESATLVKSAFTDLFKDSTKESFKRAGIEMFDPITKEAKQVDQLLLELNKRFSMVEGQEAINNLRNTFKGSEGLTTLIQIAADQTGKLQSSLKEMDGANANIDKAKDIYEKDITSLKERNRLLREGNKIMRGQKMDNPVHYFHRRVNEARESINAGLTTDLLLQEKNPEQREYEKTFGSASKFINDTYGNDKDLTRIEKRIEELENPLSMPKWENYLGEQLPKFNVKPQAEYTKQFIGSLGLNEVQLSVYDKDLNQFAGKMHSGHINGARSGELEALYDLKNNFGSAPEDGASKKVIDPLKTEGTESSIDTISGGGVQHKNITIHIGNVVDDININSQTLPEGLADIEEQVKQTLVRALQGTEQIIQQ